VRFADTPTADVAVHIGAPPSAVWAFVTDFDVLAQFSDEFQGGDWLDPSTEPGLGERFHGRNKSPTAAWKVTCTVIEWEPDRAFGWCVEDPSNPVATWQFTLEPDGDGTRLAYRARMGPGPSGVTAFIAEHPENEERIVRSRLSAWKANMESTVEGIRQLAESGPNPS
jgi:uncharacterized protein YndB with AHSA1/START domain